MRTTPITVPAQLRQRFQRDLVQSFQIPGRPVSALYGAVSSHTQNSAASKICMYTRIRGKTGCLIASDFGRSSIAAYDPNDTNAVTSEATDVAAATGRNAQYHARNDTITTVLSSTERVALPTDPGGVSSIFVPR